MKLSPEDIEAVALAVVSKIDINAIADAVCDRLQRAESIKLDAKYAASLDLDELKRRNHQKMIEENRRKKRNDR
jgi:hypothetical protein